MWAALAVSVLSLAVAGTPSHPAPELVTPDEPVPICGAATALPRPDALSAKPISPASCTASATCWDGSHLSCSDAGSGSCQGVNSNCASGVRGYVTCGGSRQDCPPCPKKTVCDCHMWNGNWGVWDGSQCALQICIIPLQ